MKRSVLASLMAGLTCSVAYAGPLSPIVEQPIPTVIPAPAAQPAAAWSVELSGANLFATKSLMGGNTTKFNIWGPELTGVYSFDEHHAFTLRGSALYGRHTRAGFGAPYLNDPYNIALGKLDLAIMPGYRYSFKVAENTNLYTGVNVGVIFTDINKHHSWGLVGDKAWGVAASAEFGVNYALNDKWSIFAAYQLSGDTARPTVNGHKQEAQVYHGVRVGIGFKF